MLSSGTRDLVRLHVLTSRSRRHRIRRLCGAPGAIRKEECLSKLILFGERSLQRALTTPGPLEYLGHRNVIRSMFAPIPYLGFQTALAQGSGQIDGIVTDPSHSAVSG